MFVYDDFHKNTVERRICDSVTAQSDLFAFENLTPVLKISTPAYDVYIANVVCSNRSCFEAQA